MWRWIGSYHIIWFDRISAYYHRHTHIYKQSQPKAARSQLGQPTEVWRGKDGLKEIFMKYNNRWEPICIVPFNSPGSLLYLPSSSTSCIIFGLRIDEFHILFYFSLSWFLYFHTANENMITHDTVFIYAHIKYITAVISPFHKNEEKREDNEPTYSMQSICVRSKCLRFTSSKSKFDRIHFNVVGVFFSGSTIWESNTSCCKYINNNEGFGFE